MNLLKKSLLLLEQREDEDKWDRINNSVTPFLLFAFAIILFSHSYGPYAQPIQCWTPAEMVFNYDWIEYVQDFCFAESTYYVPFNERVPLAGQRNNGTDRLNYYQWVPFILVAMALFSQFTHYFWSFCNMLSEKDLPSILRKVSAVMYEGDDEQAKFAEAVASHFHVVLLACDSSKKRGQKSTFLHGLAARNWLAFVYLFTKFLYLIANIVQFKFISMFLGVDKLPNWGWTMLNSFLTHGTSWEHSGHFPRVTLCDVKIRQPNDRFADFTFQCLLEANYLNEKIFMILYFWFILMAFVSLLSLAKWCWTFLFRSQTDFVKQLIELSLLQMIPDHEFDFGSASTRQDKSGTECAETEHDEAFINVQKKRNALWRGFETNKKDFMTFIGVDGIMVAKMMYSSAGMSMTSLVFGHLFVAFLQHEQKKTE